jgi:two-component system, OmpR family, sensor histidine kinase MprB
MRRRSIRSRLTLLTAAAVTSIAMLVGGLAWLGLRQTLLQQVESALRAIAQGPATRLPPADVARIQKTPLTGSPVIEVQILLPGGKIVRAAQNTVRLPISPADRAVAAGKTSEASYSVSTRQGSFQVLTVRGSHGVAFQFAGSLADVDAALWRDGMIMIALVAGAAAAGAAAGSAVAVTGLRPVGRLTRAATRIADTRDLRSPIPVAGHDEVAQLGRAFNTMLAALGDARQAQQELIEDAAHELRTPMSSMRTNIELLIRADQRLPHADRHALLADLDLESAELAELVSDLVELARAPDTEEPAVPGDLTEVVARAIRRVSARRPDARFRLDSKPVTAVARMASVERAVVNLLDNAVKFGPPGQLVDIRLAGSDDGSAEITVADRGPGIPAGEQERIFRRFHRLDAARAVPGSGLGLAIVHKTAVSHGGDVTAGPRPGGGSVFRLRLPAGQGLDGIASRDTEIARNARSGA